MNATNRVLMVILAAVLLLGAYLVIPDSEGADAAESSISDVGLIDDPQDGMVLYFILDASYPSTSFEVSHMEGDKKVRDIRSWTVANQKVQTTPATGVDFEEGIEYTLSVNSPKMVATFTLPEDYYYYVEFSVDDEIVREDTQVVQYMETAVEPAKPEKAGAKFVGWLKEDGEIFEFDTPITEYTPLTASFVPFVDEYTITYYVDDEPYGEPVTVKYGEPIVAPEYVPDTGYIFLGWEGVPETMPAENVSVYGETKLNVDAAFLHDNSGAIADDDLYETYSAEIDDAVITVSATGLKAHANGQVPPAMGYWAGFCILLNPLTGDGTGSVDYKFLNKEGQERTGTETISAEGTTQSPAFALYYNLKNWIGQEMDIAFTWYNADKSDSLEETYTIAFDEKSELVGYEATVYLDEDVIADDNFLVGEPVVFDLSEHIGLGVTASLEVPEGLEYDFTAGILTFEMPAKNVEFELVLTPVVREYTITVDSEMEGGDVTPDKYLAAEGATVTLSYAKDEGYTFVSYYAYTESTETPITVSDDGMFTMPADDVIVGAIFLPDVPVKKYTVTMLPSENGTAIPDVTEAEEGDTVTITATPADGYQTAAIYLDGQPLEVIDDEAYFLMPGYDVEVSAVFVEIPVGGSTVTYVDVTGVLETVPYKIGEKVVYHVTTVPEGMKLGYVDFEPWMATLIDQEACTVEFIAVEGNYTATISYIAPFTVTVLDQDGQKIDREYFAKDPVELDVGFILGVEVESATSEPEIDDFECKDGVITFTMPAQDVTVTVTTKPIVPVEKHTVTYVDQDGNAIDDAKEYEAGEPVFYNVPERSGADVDDVTSEPEVADFVYIRGLVTFTMPEYDVKVIVTYEPFVAPVSVTFMDGETVIDTVFVEIGGLVEEVPEAEVKEGFNFVGWCVNDIPTAIDFSELPIIDDMVVYATYVETPDIGEGFAILYHDMYKGKPVDIWWKGYASKDDRVMLANGMDATAIFMGWLAEDQETLLSWNAAYDLNDLERNDCLIYPASYGYPGTDRIYELNAIYALEIEWISFDGKTVLKPDEVIRGDYLEAPLDDEEMQDLLDDYKPSDEGYTYSWAGWNIPGVGTYSSVDVEFIKANGSWQIFATYGTEVKEYDITFNWHDGTDTQKVAYGDTPEIADPEGYEDDNFTYTFAGWDHEIVPVKGDDTYNATYVKTSLTKEVTVTVNDPAFGYFTYGDEELTEKVIEVPMDFGAADIGDDVLTFDLLFYLLDVEVPETLVFTAVPKADDTMHYEFVDWTVSDDGLTYTANFVTDIITSKDLERIQTFFDSNRQQDAGVLFTLKSKDGKAIPKGTITIGYTYYEYDDYSRKVVTDTEVCDAITMDWDESTYGDDLISETIEYADLTQGGEAFDISTKNISKIWMIFEGNNGAHCESNKAAPGGQ